MEHSPLNRWFEVRHYHECSDITLINECCPDKGKLLTKPARETAGTQLVRRRPAWNCESVQTAGNRPAFYFNQPHKGQIQMTTNTLQETLEAESAADAGEMTAIEREHYDEICELNKQVRVAEGEYLVAKAQAKAAKEELESLQSQLSFVIARGPEKPDPQQSLPFPEDAQENAWRDVPITDAIKISDKQFEKLEDAGARTMGQLEDLRAGKFPTYPDGLRSIKGFGDKAIDAIEDQIVDWLASNSRAAETEDDAE